MELQPGVRTPINPAEGLKRSIVRSGSCRPPGPNTHQPSRGIETRRDKYTNELGSVVRTPINPAEGLKPDWMIR